MAICHYLAVCRVIGSIPLLMKTFPRLVLAIAGFVASASSILHADALDDTIVDGIRRAEVDPAGWQTRERRNPELSLSDRLRKRKRAPELHLSTRRKNRRPA